MILVSKERMDTYFRLREQLGKLRYDKERCRDDYDYEIRIIDSTRKNNVKPNN